MNSISIVGNIASDIDMRKTTSGVAVANFRVAVNRRFKGADGNREADFFAVVAWRQAAEFCAKYLAKGRKVGVEGAMQSRQYKAQDGSMRTVWELQADSVEALDKPAEGRREDAGQFVEVEDEGLPF